MFATLGFFVGLAITRGITTWLHYHGAGANGGIIIKGVHIHHEVFGIFGLLFVSYGWLLLFAFENQPRRLWSLTALAYGVFSALILDDSRSGSTSRTSTGSARDVRASKRSRSSPACSSGPS